MFRVRLIPLALHYRTHSSCGSHEWMQPTGYDTGIKVFNCVADAKVPLILRNRNLATFYTCGPTVYDATHMGHASCYVKLDIVQRLLRDYFQVPLITAMNVTDIDDKIIRRAQECGKNWREVALENEAEFWQSLQSLGVGTPDYKLRVTEHFDEIREWIKTLLGRGHAYVAEDSSIYFDCATLPGHGKLAKIRPEESDSHSVIKKNRSDFALWKYSNNTPNFDSDWGTGRPGWHIECSAMASKVFGGTIDFHGGGWDLKFPHHENEESQSCAYHGTSQWVNYWLHTGQLRLKGASTKMSKSLKNTITVREFLQIHSADDFRMFCILSNYRSNTEYSDEAVQAARRVNEKFQTFLDDVERHLSGQQVLKVRNNAEFQQRITAAVDSFGVALRDDFDTARGIRVLLELISYVNKEQHETDSRNMDSGLLGFTRRVFTSWLRAMGLRLPDSPPMIVSQDAQEDFDAISAIIESVLHVRNGIRSRAKTSNDKSLFFFADHIRKQLQGAGVDIKDRDMQNTTWVWRGHRSKP